MVGFLALGGCIYVCFAQYRRYSANPVVVSVERDFHDWNGTLPAITFCYLDNLSAELADDFILRTWNVESHSEHSGDDEKYLYYKEFLSVLFSLNIYNLGELLPFSDDATLQSLDFQATINELLVDYEHYVSSFVKDGDMGSTPILTERGICYSANSVQSHLLAIGGIPSEVETDAVRCNFVQDQCFMKLDIYGVNVSIAVHSSYEPIRYETVFFELGHEDEIVATFKLLQTINDDLVRDLAFAQRNCLFYDEKHKAGIGRDNDDDHHHRVMIAPRTTDERLAETVYSVNLCLLKCRAEAAIALCGCKPHFYPFHGIGSTTSPSPRTCSLEDIKCLTVDHAWPVNVRDEDCRCPKTCNQLKYTENSFKLSTWNAGGNGIPFAQKSSFRSEVLLPRMRLRRDVLFTFEDLVVSFGSAVTLFIGLNFLDAAMLLMWSAQGLYGLVIERNCKGRCNKVNSKT